MTELKPCPFCGGKAEMSVSDPSTAHHNEGAVHFSVSCFSFKCKVMPKGNLWHINQEEAIAAWNTRADDWQPIDTAPELGWFQAYARDGFHGTQVMTIKRIANHDRYIWVSTGIFFTDEKYFTHWRPLPDPPKEG